MILARIAYLKLSIEWKSINQKRENRNLRDTINWNEEQKKWQKIKWRRQKKKKKTANINRHCMYRVRENLLFEMMFISCCLSSYWIGLLWTLRRCEDPYRKQYKNTTWHKNILSAIDHHLRFFFFCLFVDFSLFWWNNWYTSIRQNK